MPTMEFYAYCTLFHATSFQYLGVWYNPQNVPSPGEQPDPVCQRAQYGSFENGTISLYNSGSYASGEFSEICGWAEQADPENNPGELYIYFPAVTGFVERLY